MTSPNVEHQHDQAISTEHNPKRFWLISLYFFLATLLIGGSLLSFLSWQASMAEATRISESVAQEIYLAQKQAVDRATFYEGLSVEGIALGGLTYDEAQAQLAERSRERAAAVAVTLKIDDQALVLDAAMIGWRDNTAEALERAWQYARTSNLPSAVEQVSERYVLVEKLRSEPIDFKIEETYDHALAQAAIRSFVSSQQTAAKPAAATAFDPATGQFTIAERVIGRRTDPVIFQELVFSALDQKQFSAQIAVESDKTEHGMTAAELQRDLVLLGTANTYAYKVDPERDNNLQKAAEYLNGTVIQPGETFSFNESVGRRTAERGFMEAGAISDGILKKELGGGVCQVNTTVMQAAMKSDYTLVERYPHSWPSSYTKIGLDATVDWGGADFKFKNDTDYPVAIVATYVKPKLQVKLYGRRLEPGVTISLRAEQTEVIPVDPPIYRPSKTLAPGQVVEVRAPHEGKRAVAYKVYKKGETVLREEVLFKSYYRPIQGIYDVGPTVTSVDPSQATTAVAGLSD